MKAVDLFAGWGGATLGAEAAGVEVVWAANHWDLAVEAHSMNHPSTLHACQDLRQADWSLLPDYDLLWASPACQGHSQASQPKRRRYHDALRATAWAVVDCADATEPDLIVVENVPDFQRWRLYGAWRMALELMGYHLTEHTLMANDYGVPQLRKRTFVLADRRAPVWLSNPAPAQPPFGPHIEWGEGRWRPVVLAPPRARERMENGRRKHGNRFLSQHVTNHPGVPLDQPIRTITTKDQWCVVRGDEYRPLTIREYARAMGFPDTYSWPAGATRTECIKGLGNAVCPPQAAQIIREIAA